jgi:integrase
MTRWNVNPETPLEELWSRWLSEIQNELDEATVGLYELHGTTHLVPFFKSLAGITSAGCANYARKRLGEVKSVTVKKEQSTRRFLTWCEEQGYVEGAPAVPPLPRRALGTAFRLRRRGRATDLTVDEVRALLDALPEWSSPRNAEPFVVRARFVVEFETTLRPSTLNALSVPEHYQHGASAIVITDEIDKARFGRDLPLSDEARAALDAVVPKAGLIFGDHDYRDRLRKAAAAALPPNKAKTFTAYDLRHARLTQLAETGNLTGAAYLAGHKRVTTTALYVRANQSAARRALAAVGPTGVAPPRSKPASHRNRLAGPSNSSDSREQCEGGDLNPHGSNPASTSS